MEIPTYVPCREPCPLPGGGVWHGLLLYGRYHATLLLPYGRREEGGGGDAARDIPQSCKILRLILRNFERFAIWRKRKKRSLEHTRSAYRRFGGTNGVANLLCFYFKRGGKVLIKLPIAGSRSPRAAPKLIAALRDCGLVEVSPVLGSLLFSSLLAAMGLLAAADGAVHCASSWGAPARAVLSKASLQTLHIPLCAQPSSARAATISCVSSSNRAGKSERAVTGGPAGRLAAHAVAPASEIIAGAEPDKECSEAKTYYVHTFGCQVGAKTLNLFPTSPDLLVCRILRMRLHLLAGPARVAAWPWARAHEPA